VFFDRMGSCVSPRTVPGEAAGKTHKPWRFTTDAARIKLKRVYPRPSWPREIFGEKDWPKWPLREFIAALGAWC
jgi:hypothetical protein